MADEADCGNVMADRYLKGGLDEVLSRLPIGDGTAECVDCETEIPPARRAAYPGCIRCVQCQEKREG